MKKFKYIIFILLFGLIFFSCTKQEEKIYSCDPIVNEWIINNMGRILKITPAELLQYNLETQRAIFCAMNPQQRYEVWTYKIDSVLQLDWSQSVKTHITNLRNNLDQNWFDEESLCDTVYALQVDSLLRAWIKYSFDTLHLSGGLVFSIGCRIDIPKDNNVLLPTESLDFDTSQLKDSGGGGTGSCKCSTADDWCDLVGDFGECRSKLQSCKHTTWGCGWFWKEPCNGMCVLTGPGGIE